MYLNLIHRLFLIIFLYSLMGMAIAKINIPILCYHNFNPIVPGSMNLSPQKIEMQIRWMKENGFTIISLKEAADYLKGKQIKLPKRPVVITIDDGWQSAYHYLFPMVKKYQIPVTLFVYPETISKGKNALTWDELREMKKSGWVEIEGHTYSHPNFIQERKYISKTHYQNRVVMELQRSKAILENQLGVPINFLAWPFGIYDSFLKQQAKNAGYEMAFSIDGGAAHRGYGDWAQPRYMVTEHQSFKTFKKILRTSG